MKNKKPKVILLVAGEGKRLRPYTLDRPKCMVEIDGISLIDRQLAVLKSEGLNDIVMIGGYKADMLKREGIKLKVSQRYYETNMVWTLFSAEEELEGDVIVSYGDIVYSREILQALLKSGADIAVTIDKEWESYWRARNEDPLDDAETLKLRKDGTISEIGQIPKSLDEIEGQYMGLMKFSAKGVKKIKNIGNLKFTEHDITTTTKLNPNFKNRKIWIASSTHSDEEIFCAKTHLQLKKKIKNLLTILIPRHVHRAKKIKSELESLKLNVINHSSNKKDLKNADIYIVDTFGETKKFHKIGCSVFIGGSIINRGGQNPLEAARYGARILHGPNIDNFKDIYKTLSSLKISKKITNSNELASQIIFNRNKNQGDEIKKIGVKILKETINDLDKLIKNDFKKT